MLPRRLRVLLQEAGDAEAPAAATIICGPEKTLACLFQQYRGYSPNCKNLIH